jgi:hypothetical protein
MYTKAYLLSLTNAITALKPFYKRPNLLNINKKTKSSGANIGLYLV